MSISVFAVSIALSKFLLSWKSRCSTSVVPLAATFSCGEFLKTDSGKLAYTYIWKEIAKQSTRSCDWTTLHTKMAQWSSIFYLKLDKNQNHNTWNIGLGDMLKFVLYQSNHTHTHPACNVSLIGLPCALKFLDWIQTALWYGTYRHRTQALLSYTQRFDVAEPGFSI